MGLPFSRLDDGRIYQRSAAVENFGGERRRHVPRQRLTVPVTPLHTLRIAKFEKPPRFSPVIYALGSVVKETGMLWRCG